MSASKGQRVRLTLRLPAELYDALLVLQGRTGKPINDLIVQLLKSTQETKMKIDTENDNVEWCTLSITTAREALDQLSDSALTDALDNAQAHVFTEEHPKAYLIIEIVP